MRTRQCHAHRTSATRLSVWLAMPALVSLAISCGHRRELPPIIQVSNSQVTVQNQTEVTWSNVEVWVNYHYRQTIPRLEKGQVFVVPLDMLVAAYGRRFDRRQAVFGVEVTARSSDGRPVRLTWGNTRR
jgi:hypothetical protein